MLARFPHPSPLPEGEGKLGPMAATPPASSRSVILEPVPLQETAQGMEQAIKGLLLRLEDLLLFLPLRFDVCQELLHLCAALGKGPGQDSRSLRNELSGNLCAGAIELLVAEFHLRYCLPVFLFCYSQGVVFLHQHSQFSGQLCPLSPQLETPSEDPQQQDSQSKRSALPL